MVFPTTVYMQVTFGVALLFKAQFFQQARRTDISWHIVSTNPVKSKTIKGIINSMSDYSGHHSLALIVSIYAIAHVAIEAGTIDDIG